MPQSPVFGGNYFPSPVHGNQSTTPCPQTRTYNHCIPLQQLNSQQVQCSPQQQLHIEEVLNLEVFKQKENKRQWETVEFLITIFLRRGNLSRAKEILNQCGDTFWGA